MPVNRRPRNKRLNMGVLVTGQTGSGKSRMQQFLARVWRRKLFVDPMDTFDADVITYNFTETMRALGPRWVREDFSISCVYDNDAEYDKLFAALKALLQESQGMARDFLLVVDEVDRWSSPNKIHSVLSWLLRYGRHYGMSWAVSCRADVHTHRDARMNAQYLLFRQGMPSSDVDRDLRGLEVIRDGKIPVLGRLTLHGPNEPPEAVENVHFVSAPDTFADWKSRWDSLANAA